jgi:hypothetical protein
MDMPTGHDFIANADNTVRILEAHTGDVLRTMRRCVLRAPDIMLMLVCHELAIAGSRR